MQGGPELPGIEVIITLPFYRLNFNNYNIGKQKNRFLYKMSTGTKIRKRKTFIFFKVPVELL